MSREEWVAHHRCQGHNPHPAPTIENPERWECKCDPEAVWTAVWRILTPEQVRQKFAHLSTRPTPARDAQRRELRAHIAEIQAEQENRNAALRNIDHSPIPPLRIVDRYAGGISQDPAPQGNRDERRRASRPGCGDPHAVADWRDGGGRPQAGLGGSCRSIPTSTNANRNRWACPGEAKRFITRSRILVG